ncbi:MAG: hypothetical protein ACRDZ8_17895 [Acidimicrobiales bacterium]
MDPAAPDGHRRVYAARTKQLLLAGSILAIYLCTISLIWEPDPDTGIRPTPGDYLPIVIPGTILVLWLIWRALKARVETSDGGVRLVRVVGKEWFPWSDVRGFELLPSPSKRGATVRLRQQNETLVIVRSEVNLRPPRDRDERRRRATERAVAFRDVLEADRVERMASYRPQVSAPARGGMLPLSGNGREGGPPGPAAPASAAG